MSLLLANGHADAWTYPIWMLWVESQIVTERLNQMLGSHVLLTKMALDATPNMGVKGSATRKAATAFSKIVKAMMGDG